MTYPDGSPLPSRAVIEAVAAAEGVDPTDIEPPQYEPLYTVIDPEALDELFWPHGSTQRGTGVVHFTYEGYDVTVSSDGSVSVDVASGPTTSTTSANS